MHVQPAYFFFSYKLLVVCETGQTVTEDLVNNRLFSLLGMKDFFFHF